MKHWIWILGGIGALALMIALGALVQHQTQPDLPDPKAFPNIHVEVLNGCGADGVAGRVGEALRDLGFDVMTLGNAENFNYPETIVIDRVGNREFAQQVAEMLGTENRIQQITPDPFRIEEVTVVVGRDYPHLPILKKQ